MANVAKYTRAQIGGMVRHYERAQKENGEYQTFGNQDIDVSRIHLNYNLAPERDGGQLRFIKQRTSEVHCLTRENINVMCSWVITLPKTFGEVCEVDESGKLIYNYDEIDNKIFFREAYRFLNDRYANGSDKNVISAYVHMDETTPHMHYAFVPVVWDEKKGIDKVSAKAVINRFDLKSFHPDLEKHMAEVFGYEVGILNEATRDGNKSVEELKRGTAQTQLSEVNAELSQINSTVSRLQSKELELQDKILKLEEERALSEAQLMGIEHNMSVERQKGQNFARKLQDEVIDLEEKSKALEGQIERNKTYLKSLEGQINPLQQNLAHLTAVNAEYQAKKKYIDKAKESSDISMMYPSYTETSTRGFGKNKTEYVTVPAKKWEEKHVSANEVDYLQKMRDSLEKSIADFKKSQSGESYKVMTDEIECLEDENANLKGRVRSYESQLNNKDKENKALENKVSEVLDKINRVLGKIDDRASDEFIKEWKAEEQPVKRQPDLGRGR